MESLEWEKYIAWKKIKKHAWNYVFFPKVWHFLSFFSICWWLVACHMLCWAVTVCCKIRNIHLTWWLIFKLANANEMLQLPPKHMWYLKLLFKRLYNAELSTLLCYSSMVLFEDPLVSLAKIVCIQKWSSMYHFSQYSSGICSNIWQIYSIQQYWWFNHFVDHYKRARKES